MQALTVRGTTAPSIPTEHEMMVYHTMAEQAVSSKMYRGVGEKSGVMMIMLASRELGIPPMQALNGGLNIINGKVEISARMMSALIRKSGHQITTQECTDQRCILIGKRTDTGETQTASFSIEEAQRAGLIKQGGGWTKFPKDMCFARALSRLARQLFSDVIGMGYVEGEISQADVRPIQTIEPEVLDEMQQLTYESEEDLIQSFLTLFSEEDQSVSMEWLKMVQKYSDWTLPETIKKVTADKPRMTEKFNAWKAKKTSL
jgi:hypothetical protein